MRLKQSVRSIVGCCAVLLTVGAGVLPLPGAAQAQRIKRADVKTKVNPTDGATAVWVPAAVFTMGAGADVHQVTLTRGYWLYQVPVTNGQYRKFMQATKHQPEPAYWSNPDFSADPQPVVGVTHKDALDYSKWAGGRLPTEAEWEWAARGPEGSKFPWGNEDPTDRLAVFKQDDGSGPDHPAPVGSRPEGMSWCGALDMAGNVTQWCMDWYIPQVRGEAATDPVIAEKVDADARVIRGGSWVHSAAAARSFYRSLLPPDATNDTTGFRLVLTEVGK